MLPTGLSSISCRSGKLLHECAYNGILLAVLLDDEAAVGEAFHWGRMIAVVLEGANGLCEPANYATLSGWLCDSVGDEGYRTVIKQK